MCATRAQDVDEAELSADEARERRIMKLLLKVKNGTPPQRKAALRQLTDKARELGAGPLFNQILPLLVSCAGGRLGACVHEVRSGLEACQRAALVVVAASLCRDDNVGNG